MARPYAYYVKEIQQGLFYGATWTPGTLLKLGTIGIFEDGVFMPQGHLRTMGIRTGEEKDPKPTSYTYVSRTGVALHFKAKGQSGGAFKSLAEADAGVAISFSRESAVVFSSSKCYENRIANILALQAELARLLNAGMWKEEWAVVTHLVDAGAATIVLSGSGNTTVELEADASDGQGPTKVGSLSAGVKVAYADSMNQLIIAEEGLTPLFHTLRIKRSWWTGKPGPVYNKAALAKSGSTGAAAGRITAEAFEQVDYDPDTVTEAVDLPDA